MECKHDNGVFTAIDCNNDDCEEGCYSIQCYDCKKILTDEEQKNIVIPKKRSWLHQEMHLLYYWLHKKFVG
jgi:hypothetical protein